MIFAVLEPVSLVANEQIAAVFDFRQALDVRAKALVASNEDVEQLRLDETVDVLLYGLPVAFRQGKGLDSPLAQPLDELVVPVLDETAGTNDDDTLR